MQNQPYAGPTAEQHARTKTRASSVYKHTPKNSTIQRATMRKFTQNAPQPSQLYSHSYPTITHWNNADSSFIVINSGYMFKKQFIRTVLIETLIVNVLLVRQIGVPKSMFTYHIEGQFHFIFILFL